MATPKEEEKKCYWNCYHQHLCTVFISFDKTISENSIHVGFFETKEIFELLARKCLHYQKSKG